MHQSPGGRPGQFDHSFFLSENLEGNNFFLKIFTLPDAILRKASPRSN
jgi:hypothetical protein